MIRRKYPDVNFGVPPVTMKKFLSWVLEPYSGSRQQVAAVLKTEMESKSALKLETSLQLRVTVISAKLGWMTGARLQERPRQCGTVQPVMPM